MPCFLVEMFLARGRAEERAARVRAAQLASEELARDGSIVELERSIHVPEDEICFFVFSAASADDVAIVAQRAGLDPVRIVQASTKEET